jgi:galactokinase
MKLTSATRRPYRLTHGATRDLPDVVSFLDTLNQLATHPVAEVRELFDAAGDLIVSRAPGRLDVMGGIADYSGSLVLQMPLRAATLVALQLDSMRHLRIVSLGPDSLDPRAHDRTVAVDLPLAVLERPDGTPADYDEVRRYFAADPHRRWAAYVAGALLVLRRERGVTFDRGARLLISSTVPEGKGVSSSAALEVASMQAIAAAFHIQLADSELARLAQLVEHRVVGAPCGIMDQMTATCGERDRLLVLRCQPADLLPSLAWPDDLGLWGIDSGERHAITGADYTSVRAGAFMGYRLIADLAGLTVTKADEDGHVRIEDPIWNGFLANVTPAEFETRFQIRIPERMRGADFLARYGGTPDAVTRVDPTRDYAVRAPTRHPIGEHARIQVFAELLARAAGAASSDSRVEHERMGALMYESHAGYAQCGLDSAGTSRLVALVREAGRSAGLYGARITGGGSGGTVAVLGHREAAPIVARIAARYAEESGHPADIITGSSPGAAEFGYLRLQPAS